MNGKGDSPRNCFSKQYRDNYDSICWNRNKEKKKKIKYVDIDNKEPECTHCGLIYCDCDSK